MTQVVKSSGLSSFFFPACHYGKAIQDSCKYNRGLFQVYFSTYILQICTCLIEEVLLSRLAAHTVHR